MRILPNVFAVHNQVLSECLLEAGMKLITLAGAQWNGEAGIALARRHETIDNGVIASSAGQDQVLVKRRFHDASVRSPQHGVGMLDVIGNADARLQ